MATLLPDPHRTTPAIAQGWRRLAYARTCHWMRWDGTTLCNRWERDDLIGPPTAEPEAGRRACVLCSDRLAATQKGGN